MFQQQQTQQQTQLIKYLHETNQLDKYICNMLENLDVVPDDLLKDYYMCCKALSKTPFIIGIHDFTCTDTKDIDGLTHIMFSSNPCIFKDTDGTYKMNIRMINYFMDEVENRLYYSNKTISINKLLTLSFDNDDNSLMTVDTIHYFDITSNLDKKNNGLEDLRVYETSNGLGFIGSAQVSKDNEDHIGIIIGKYDTSKSFLEPVNIYSPFDRIKEKNWVFFGNKIIYQWFPLTIASITNDGTLDILDTIPSNPFFRNIRGSSNGCFVKNKETGDEEIWFLCHGVNIENTPRHYYHCFVILENVIENEQHKIRIKKWSLLFKFEGCRIEFSLGMIVEDTRILVSYSTWDKTSKIMILDREGIEKNLF